MAGHQGTSTRNDGLEQAFALAETERADINTSTWGKIVAYDAKTQTATVQPLLSMTIAGENVRAPELLSVPVMHPRAGGQILHKPPKKGDPVRLDFMQRSMDQSADDDSDFVANRGRMHSLSDAVATPAAYSKSQQLPSLPADRMHFGTQDGKSGFQMKDDGSFDLVRNGDTLFKLLTDFIAAFRDHQNDGKLNDKKPDAEKLLDRAKKMMAT